jgi:hypothetical protein
MTEWLVIAALAVSLVNAFMVIGLTVKFKETTKLIDMLILQSIITAEIIELMEQENNADE